MHRIVITFWIASAASAWAWADFALNFHAALGSLLLLCAALGAWSLSLVQRIFGAQDHD